MKLYKISILLLLVVGFFSCKQPSPKRMHLDGLAQGTYYSITYYDFEKRDFQDEVDSLLQAFDQSVSVYQPQSIVSRVNGNDNDVQLDDWFVGNFKLSQRISTETNGSFDITIAPVANVWGFGTFEKPDSVDTRLIDSLKAYVDYRKVRIEHGKLIKDDPAIQLNFNAIAQGYSVDVLGGFLESKGIERYIVDVGGEILTRGTKPNGDLWKIGIEIPKENNEARFYNSIIELSDEAVATSGNYRKFYVINGVKYAHSINPLTGYPVQHSLLSATVIAPSAAEADAYATAFMVMGVDKTLEFVQEHSQLKVYLMFDKDGEVKTTMSDNFGKYLKEGSE